MEVRQGRRQRYPGKDGTLEDLDFDCAAEGPIASLPLPFEVVADAKTIHSYPDSKLSEAIHNITSTVKDETAVIRANGDRQITALADLKREADKHADATSRVKDDTAVIRATGERHNRELDALKNEAHKQSVLTSTIVQDTSQIGALQAVTMAAQEAELRAQILEWLSDDDYPKEQHDNISRYKEGTGMWLLEDPKFKEWKSGPYDTLFCVGMPGAGKTVMSSMVIRHLFETSRDSNDKIAVAFLYFRHNLRDTQSTQRLMSSLARQLVDQTDKAPDSIVEAYNKRFKHHFETRPLQEILQAAVDCFHCVYFVIDALDESTIQQTKDLVCIIRSLRKAQIKLFATSRSIPEISEQFKSDKSIEIKGSPADIESYATHRLSELPRCVQNSSTLQAEIVQAIISSTEGMFLLAKLHIDLLKDKRTPKAMRGALHTLPSGSGAYDTAYDLAMSRIRDQSENDFKLAQDVLTWLVYAMRPISPKDLESAVAVELEAKHLDPENVVNSVELLSLCAGLVTLDEESKTIRLVHYTTQEFFSRNPQHLHHNPHRLLSNICVSYLGLDDFLATNYIEEPCEKHLSSHVHSHPFLAYAAAHWDEHDREALPFINDEEEAKVWTLELRLLRNHQLMESYLRARGKWARKYRNGRFGLHVFVFERMTGMQYAAATGKLQRVSNLLKAGIDPNESRNDTTALIEAARGHHESVVKLLIEAKSNTGFQTEDTNHTALTVAIGMKGRKGHSDPSAVPQNYYCPSTGACEATVSLLLEAGTDPEHVTGDPENLTPLMHAAQHGMQIVVAMLCRAGADVNRKLGSDLWMTRGQTALHVAASHGHYSIVKQLLQYHRNPDSTDSNKTSPSAYAAQGQHWKVVELLLDTTAVDSARNTPNGDSMLELACRSESCPDELLKRLLLESLDLVNTNDRPLIRATEAKKVAAVKMLLEAGADPRITDRNGDTALHTLARLDHHCPRTVSIGIAQALLGADMDVDTRARNGVTALMLASGGGQQELVCLLLQNGANWMLKDTVGSNALSYAAQGGHFAIVTTLLRAGATSQTDPSFIRAASFGHVSVLRILTSWGVDVDMTTEDGTTALMSAARHGRLEAARMLIEAGAAVNPRTSKGRSPLMLSAAQGHKDVMKLLLQKGADASVTNERGETALICVMRTEIRLQTGCVRSRRSFAGERQVKSSVCIQEVISVLLEAGVDVNASTDDGDSALLLATDPNYPSPDDVRLLFDAGADPSIAKRAKSVALVSWDRIKYMDVPVLERLLKAGADPNERDAHGMTTLMRVSWRWDHVEQLKLLLQYGARPDAVDDARQTALTLAVHETNRYLCPDIVKELLNAGANPNHEDAGGKSVLIHLVSRGHYHDTTKYTEILTALVDAGGDISAVGKNHETLLMLSIRHSGMVNPLLAAGADPHGSDKKGRNTVMLASITGSHDDTDAVRSLLDAGVDPDQRDRNGYNALMVAARYSGSSRALRTLMRAGMSPHERDAKNRTLLMLVMINQCASSSPARPGARWEMLSELIEAGVGVDLRDRDGNTALMYAAEHHGPAGLLLKAGADPNLINHLGQTALMKCFLGPQLEYKKTKRASGDEGHGVVDNDGDKVFRCGDRVQNKEIANLIRAEIKRRETSSKVEETVHHALGGIEVPIQNGSLSLL